MHMRFWYRLHILLWTLLILVLGYALGRFFLFEQTAGAPAPIVPLNTEVHERVPVVQIREINGGDFIGMVGTGARLLLGDAVVVPSDDGSFRIPADPLLRNIIDVAVPEGALFVASRQGTKYYPVNSSSAKRLVPQNRVYFRSAEEAEGLGYERGK